MLSKNKYFFYPFIICALIVVGILIYLDKMSIHLYTNRYYNIFFDWFFSHYTHVGHGFFLWAIILVMLFTRYSHALAMLINFAFTGIVILVLKFFVFDTSLRPKKYFEQLGDGGLRFIDGLEVHSFNSMPSGHTATAFSMFCLLALIAKNKKLGIIYFLLAALVGYSRIYLNQHFLEDVTVGALVGCICAIGVYYLHEIMLNSEKLSKSLLNR